MQFCSNCGRGPLQRRVTRSAGLTVDSATLDLHVVSNLPQIGEIFMCFRRD